MFGTHVKHVCLAFVWRRLTFFVCHSVRDSVGKSVSCGVSHWSWQRRHDASVTNLTEKNKQTNKETKFSMSMWISYGSVAALATRQFLLYSLFTIISLHYILIKFDHIIANHNNRLIVREGERKPAIIDTFLHTRIRLSYFYCVNIFFSDLVLQLSLATSFIYWFIDWLIYYLMLIYLLLVYLLFIYCLFIYCLFIDCLFIYLLIYIYIYLFISPPNSMLSRDNPSAGQIKIRSLWSKRSCNFFFYFNDLHDCCQ